MDWSWGRPEAKNPVWTILQKLGKKNEGIASYTASGKSSLCCSEVQHDWVLILAEPLCSGVRKSRSLSKPPIFHLQNELVRPEILQDPFQVYKSKILLSIENNI